VSTLLLGKPPSEPEALPDQRTFAFGVAKKLTTPTLLALHDAQGLREAVQEIFEELGLSPQVPLGEARLDRTDPEQLARQERARLGIRIEEQWAWPADYRAWAAWRQTVEALNIIVLQYGFPSTQARGMSLSGDGRPPAILVNSEEGYRPRIFTLFHEYAHLLLGPGAVCVPEVALLSRSQTPEVEAFCNRFAAALLVPLEPLQSHPAALGLANRQVPPADEELSSLAALFEVSPYVIWGRLRRAKLITDRVYQAKWQEWAGRFRNVRPSKKRSDGGPSPVQEALSSRGSLASVLIEAHDRNAITTAELVELLRMRSRHLPQLEEALSAARRR
jgi:Zn-dependent peptidase ImmA (M78 family)